LSNNTQQEIGKIAVFGLAILAIGWLLSQIAKQPKGQVTYYRCPKCGALVRPHASFCQSCGQTLIWEETGNPDRGRRPTRNNSSFFVIKIVAVGFLISIVMLGVCTFIQVAGMAVWSHLASVLGGYLAGSLGVTYHPPS